MRLDKLIASSSDYSRKEVKDLIRARSVEVVGFEKITPKMAIGPDQQVLVHGKPIVLLGLQYWMFHKPKGLISAKSDANRPTVFDIIDIANKQQLQLVGRLDKDTTGLLLLTNDGQWNHRIAHPKKTVYKVYLVTLEKPMTADMIERLEAGIYLAKEDCTTQPAIVEKTAKPTVIKLSIGEGKYHQVKRMMLAVGNSVLDLHREKIGSLVLDPNLEPGKYRTLTPSEIEGCIIGQESE